MTATDILTARNEAKDKFLHEVTGHSLDFFSPANFSDLLLLEVADRYVRLTEQITEHASKVINQLQAVVDGARPMPLGRHSASAAYDAAVSQRDGLLAQVDVMVFAWKKARGIED